jgi:tryptophanyl-tRNA synthetase
LATEDQLTNILNFGRKLWLWSHKQALFELICAKFKTEREKYNYYLNNLEEVDSLLKIGAGKASKVANELFRVRKTRL